MVAPDDRLANILFQDTNQKMLAEFESKAKRLNYKVYMNYPYKDERAVTGTVEVDPQSSAANIMGRRRVRILGALLNVAWTTDLATTRAAIATAVGAISV